jgi:hypothetical protein
VNPTLSPLVLTFRFTDYRSAGETQTLHDFLFSRPLNGIEFNVSSLSASFQGIHFYVPVPSMFLDFTFQFFVIGFVDWRRTGLEASNSVGRALAPSSQLAEQPGSGKLPVPLQSCCGNI